jgi:hypothetical protein
MPWKNTKKEKDSEKKMIEKNYHQKGHMSCPITTLVNKSYEIHLNKTGQILPLIRG